MLAYQIRPFKKSVFLRIWFSSPPGLPYFWFINQVYCKTMENPVINQNTGAFRFQVWASFALSFSLMIIGICYLPVDLWIKGYLLMGTVFTVASCFTLAKTLRDDHEAGKLINRITGAKTEKILKEYESV